MNGRHIIAIVIGIMDKNNVRMSYLKIIVITGCNRHIVRKIAAFIMLLAQASVRILIEIGDRNHIRI